MLKFLYLIQVELNTFMHSKIYFSNYIFQSNYRNSLRSSSSGKLNYPQCYLYKFTFYIIKFKLIFIFQCNCKLNKQLNNFNVLQINKNINFFNDPSAGSPTETLLRLLLPLNKEIYIHFLINK